MLLKEWKWPLISMISLWILVVLGCGFYFFNYNARPGAGLKFNITHWPFTTGLKVNPLKGTFLMFLHPKCFCSEASLGELERLLPMLKEQAELKIIFMDYSGMDLDWSEVSTYQMAKNFKIAEVVIDKDGRERNIFGVQTSGHSFLFDKKGNLVFQGGLTAYRGQRGPAAAQDQIASWLKSQHDQRFVSSVFGCEL